MLSKNIFGVTSRSFAPGSDSDSTTRDQAYDDQSSNLYPLLPSSVVVQHLKGNEPTIFQGVKHIRVCRSSKGRFASTSIVHCSVQSGLLQVAISWFYQLSHWIFKILLYNWMLVGMQMARCLHYMPSSALLSFRSAENSADVSIATQGVLRTW